MNNFFDNQRILNLIWERKFHFVAIGLIAIFLSAIFSGSTFIKPKFRSTARVYPTTNIATFSNESESEQILEIINSRDIKLKMFDVFGLDKVYRISKDNPQYLTYMMDKYNTNVSASKTEYETIEIKVLDEDPVRASNMCDSIIAFFNYKVQSMHSAKQLEVVRIAGKFISEREHELDSVKNLLQQLRNNTGIVNFGEYSEAVAKGYIRAMSGSGNLKLLKQQLDNVVKNGEQAVILEKQFGKLVNVVDSMKMIVKIAYSEANKNISYCHIVEKPIPADKKSYPVRWMIVGFSTASAVFMALLIFLLLDYRKNQ